MWAKLQSAVPELTGVFCYSDMVAFRLLLYLQKLGIRCPEDISICGYGYPKDFSVDQRQPVPGRDRAHRLRKLIGIIEGKSSASASLFTPVELVNINATVGWAKEHLK